MNHVPESVAVSDTLTRKVVLSVLLSIACWGLMGLVAYATLLSLSKWG
jgi:hypothetical protein